MDVKSDIRARPDWLIRTGLSALLAAAFAFAPIPADADLQIDITQGHVKPMPIAIADFVGTTADAMSMGQEIAHVIASDLERSGLFDPIDRNAFLGKEVPLSVLPRFADWKVIKAQALVHGATTIQEDNRLRVEFRLWDIGAQTQLEASAYFSTPENWRRVAHIISDAVYSRITGESGYFDTRIVYISEEGPWTHRVKNLAIMDVDGENIEYLTTGSNSLILTPRFSPSTMDITYLSFVNRQPRVYLFNIETGQQEMLGNLPSMTFAPRFSPDGRAVIMSYAENGKTNIFTLDLATRAIRQLTDTPAIDTSPSYAPDGKQIVFMSDRKKSPTEQKKFQRLYIMDDDGRNVRSITEGRNGKYSTPVWSPRGDLIAFTKQYDGRFAIGVMRTDGSGERLLVQTQSVTEMVEGPTWAPNGRVLMFFRTISPDETGRGGSVKLYSIDLTGANEREIRTVKHASDPAWSPLRP